MIVPHAGAFYKIPIIFYMTREFSSRAWACQKEKKYEDEVKLFVYGHEILGKWNFRYVLSISVSTKIQVRAKFPSAHHKFTINEFPWNNEFPVRSACLRPEQYFFHVL